jgi:hypothetical protein
MDQVTNSLEAEIKEVLAYCDFINSCDPTLRFLWEFGPG